MQKVFTRPIEDLAASQKLAQECVEKYFKPTQNFTLFLKGGLGAGKTFFAREILQGLGVRESIASPTYAIVNEYGAFAHFDFYRLEESQDFFARGFTDIASDMGVSCIVEWPEKISPEAISSFSGDHFMMEIELGIEPEMRTVTLFSL